MSSQPNAQPRSHSYIGFNGQLHESNCSWQILGNGHRAYNPILMRFHSPDSLSPMERGGINAYTYCEGDPVGREDPSGRSSMYIGTGVFSLLVGGLATFAAVKETNPAERIGAIAIAAASFIVGAASIAYGMHERSAMQQWMRRRDVSRSASTPSPQRGNRVQKPSTQPVSISRKPPPELPRVIEPQPSPRLERAHSVIGGEADNVLYHTRNDWDRGWATRSTRSLPPDREVRRTWADLYGYPPHSSSQAQPRATWMDREAWWTDQTAAQAQRMQNGAHRIRRMK